MFIYTVRGRTVKFVMILVLMVVLTVLVGVLGGGESLLVSASAAEIDYSDIKTNEDRVRFIESFGIEVEDDPISISTAPYHPLRQRTTEWIRPDITSRCFVMCRSSRQSPQTLICPNFTFTPMRSRLYSRTPK